MTDVTLRDKTIQATPIQRLIVEGDAIDKIRFTIARVWGGHDLSTATFLMKFALPSGAINGSAMTVEPVADEDDTIVVVWDPSGDATSETGRVEIQMFASLTEDASTYYWQSKIAAINVERTIALEEVVAESQTYLDTFMASITTLQTSITQSVSDAEDARDSAIAAKDSAISASTSSADYANASAGYRDEAQGYRDSASDYSNSAAANASVAAAAANSAELLFGSAESIAAYAQVVEQNALDAAASASASAASAAGAAASEAGVAADAAAAESAKNTAATHALSASSSASAASASAASASTDASTASQQRVLAETAKTAAESAQGGAETAQSAAESAQAAAEAAQAAAESAADNFDDTWLGAKASEPTVDNDGDPLDAGDMYLNTTDEKMYYYTGSSWVTFSVSLLNEHINDTSGAHAASAISVADAGELLEATTVEGALSEMQGAIDDLEERMETAEAGIISANDNAIAFAIALG